MYYEIVTRGGTTYHIDTEGGWWQRFPKSENRSIGCEMRRLYAVHPIEGVNDDFHCGEPFIIPEVGERFYVAGRDVWYWASPVVSVRMIGAVMPGKVGAV